MRSLSLRDSIRRICIYPTYRLSSSYRSFSLSHSKRKILSIHDLPDRVPPQYSREFPSIDPEERLLIFYVLAGPGESKLLNLSWRKLELPRNVLLVKKPGVNSVRAALIEFAT